MLEHEKYYHVYNRTNGPVALFKDEADYKRFLRLMERFIPPVADLLAWALMGNHFHFVVRIKEARVYIYSPEDFKENSTSPNRTASPEGCDPCAFGDIVRFEDVKWETIPAGKQRATTSGNAIGSAGRRPVPAKPTNHFSHLFNAYAKYFNLRHNRTGSLFQPQFKRKPIDSENDLRQAIIYTHQNPVKHGFVNSLQEYPYTSYHEYTDATTKNEVIKLALGELFGDVKNFVAVHQQIADLENFEEK